MNFKRKKSSVERERYEAFNIIWKSFLLCDVERNISEHDPAIEMDTDYLRKGEKKMKT